MPSPAPSKNVSINAAAPSSPCKHLWEQQRKVSGNIGHSSCTRNGDNLDLIITTGNTRKEKMMSQTIIHTFKKRKGRGWNAVGAQMVVCLIIKEMSYSVMGLLDDLVGPLLFLFLWFGCTICFDSAIWRKRSVHFPKVTQFFPISSYLALFKQKRSH